MKFVAQRFLGSTGDWYDIPDREDNTEFVDRHLCELNARTRVSAGDFGSVPMIRIVQVLDQILMP